MKTKRGEITTILLVALAVAFLAPKVAPSLFDGRTKEANASANASAKVEATHAKELAAVQAQGAAVAASVNQIGVAAAQLPDSPQASFITREAAFITPLLRRLTP